jgi:hypothetical protein
VVGLIGVSNIEAVGLIGVSNIDEVDLIHRGMCIGCGYGVWCMVYWVRGMGYGFNT